MPNTDSSKNGFDPSKQYQAQEEDIYVRRSPRPAAHTLIFHGSMMMGVKLDF